MAEADVSCVVGTIGVVIPFVVTENGTPISNALSATVTWLADDGRRRPLTLEVPISAVFTYTLSAGDYHSPRRERGQLRVSFGANVFYSDTFTIAIVPHI